MIVHIDSSVAGNPKEGDPKVFQAHFDTQIIFQDLAKEKSGSIVKVAGVRNMSDIFIKYVDKIALSRYLFRF